MLGIFDTLFYVFDLCCQIMIAIGIKWIVYARWSISFNPRSLIELRWSKGADHAQLLYNSDERLFSEKRLCSEKRCVQWNFHYQTKLFQRILTPGANILNTFRYDLWLGACQHDKTTQWRKNKTSKYNDSYSKTAKYKVRLHYQTRKMLSKEI